MQQTSECVADVADVAKVKIPTPKQVGNKPKNPVQQTSACAADQIEVEMPTEKRQLARKVLQL